MQGEWRAIDGKATESMAGRLLVAAPTLKDPNFDRTVVLLVAHEPGGALGVVLNRATEIPVADVLGDWGELARHPAVIFEGGPVQPDSAICLARMRHPLRRMKSFQQISGAIGTLDLSVDPAQLQDAISGIRVFAGYSGWEPGQLEQEVEGGSWFVLDALPGDAFMDRPDDLWPMVLRRQGGLMAAVAHFPADVALN
ncbi:YqgE/AlgH family protein [Salinispora arenicola]|uniref:YqgE/AlgH family protein n=1 Tax=Salinispora arenicola TaxID=168697 RepID=UPI000364A48A|nr:YqgE/AlgH family protein [Salinispora arenicola]